MFALLGQMTPHSASMVFFVINIIIASVIITIIIVTITIIIVTITIIMVTLYQEFTTGHTRSPMIIHPSALKTMDIQVFAD